MKASSLQKPNQESANNRRPENDSGAAGSIEQVRDIKLGILPSALIVFLISLACCLYSNLYKGPAPTISLFDSGHYMETTRQMVLYIQHLFGAHVAADKLADYLMIDGPIIPLVFAIPFMLFGIAPTLADWAGFVIVQACLQSLSALFVFLLSYRMTGNKKWGMFAGLAWGLYAPAIVCAKHVLTETLALCLLLALVFVLSSIVRLPGKQAPRFLLAGVLDGLLFLTKPALVFAWGLINAQTYLLLSPLRKRIQFLILAFAGLTLLITPWMLFTKEISGKYCVTVPRVPTFNLVNGIWPEIEGWGEYPNNPMIAMITEEVGPIPALNGLLKVQPAEIINLSARKIARVWANPWNDYRYKILNVNAGTQALWHRILLLLGFAGLMVALAQPARLVFNAGNFITFASIEIIVAHFAYAPFESVQRYTYTAMPFVILFAAYFLHHLDQKRMWKAGALWVALPGMAFSALLAFDLLPFLIDVCGSAKAAFIVSLIIRFFVLVWMGLGVAKLAKESQSCLSTLAKAGLALLFVGYAGVLAAYAFNTRQIDEWTCSLKPGQAAIRQLSLANVLKDEQARERLNWALVLVDANQSLSDARVTVNNKVVSSKFVSLYQFDPAHYELINVMQTIASGIGRGPSEIRQWRAVPVPVEWLNLDGQNEIRIEPGAGLGPRLAIYGDYPLAPKGRKSFLAPEYFAHNKLWSTMDGLDGRIVDPTRIKSVPSHSVFFDGAKLNDRDLSSALGKQSGDFRIHLALGFARPQANGQPIERVFAAQAGNRFSKQLKAAEFSPSLPSSNSQGIFISKEIIGKQPMASCVVNCPADATKSTHLRVNFVGSLKASDGPSAFNLVIAVNGKAQNAVPVVLPQTHKLLAESGQWQNVSLQDEVAVDSVLGGINNILVEVYPVAGKTELKNALLQLSSVNLPTFKKHVVSIF